MDNKKAQLHVSALNMLGFCGEQFRRAYIEKERIPPGVAMLVGTGVDRAVTKNLQNKIDKGELLPVAEVTQEARDTVTNEWASGVRLDDEEAAVGIAITKGAAVDKAVRLSSLHAVEMAPRLAPTHVQRGWVVELAGFPVDLAGTIDVQEGGAAVRDTKTKGKSPSATVAEFDDQLTMYAMAVKVLDGTAPKSVALDCLIDNKTPVLKSFVSTRDDDDFKALLARTEMAVTIMDKGAFMPVKQTDPLCSPKYCGYWQTCKYVRRPKTFQIGATSE